MIEQGDPRLDPPRHAGLVQTLQHVHEVVLKKQIEELVGAVLGIERGHLVSQRGPDPFPVSRRFLERRVQQGGDLVQIGRPGELFLLTGCAAFKKEIVACEELVSSLA